MEDIHIKQLHGILTVSKKAEQKSANVFFCVLIVARAQEPLSLRRLRESLSQPCLVGFSMDLAVVKLEPGMYNSLGCPLFHWNPIARKKKSGFFFARSLERLERQRHALEAEVEVK